MSHEPRLDRTTLRRLRGQVVLSWAGLWLERLSRALWPAVSLGIVVWALLSLGLPHLLPPRGQQAVVIAAALAVLVLAALGLRGLHRPDRAEALARLDASLPDRPLAALADSQAMGAEDPASAELWALHRQRMAERTADLRVRLPDADLPSRDPVALRLLALTLGVVAILFGTGTSQALRDPKQTALPPDAQRAGASWEGWIRPPAHVGRPTLYLNDIVDPLIEVPQGSRISMRFYGDEGLDLEQDVGSTGDQDQGAAQGRIRLVELVAERDGHLRVTGQGGREWQLVLQPDLPPSVSPTGQPERQADGRMKLPFTASDDHGVLRGHARMVLDLPAVDRRHGLTIAPDPREDLIVDLPMPYAGDRRTVNATLIEDLARHPLANLPVRLTLTVEDAAHQQGQSDPMSLILPGRRFFDPLAAAVAEVRRDILWSTANAPRSALVLRAVSHRPENFVTSPGAWLALRDAIHTLEGEPLDETGRTALADALWELALMLEQGDLSSALAELQRAQDRLDQAMREGASQSEIDQLMKDLRQAMDAYMAQLARQGERGDQMRTSDADTLEMSGEQLQQMLDRLQQLMSEGRMAEAMELMEMLRQLMENMQVVQGEGQGQGEGHAPGQGRMSDLTDNLRRQQQLSDDSFRELQRQPRPQQGQDQGEGQDQDGTTGQELAERQRSLRNQLRALGRTELPGDGTPEAEAGRRALDRSGEAMERAEEALREGDLPGALDRQAEALQALREGMRAFNDAQAQEQADARGARDGQDQPPAQGGSENRGSRGGNRDPLGRQAGESGRIGTDQQLLGEEGPQRRAQDLFDELRRRSAERERPEDERDYLRRLLDQF